MPLAKNIGMKKSGFVNLEKQLQKALLHQIVEPAERSVKQTAETVAIVAQELAPEDTKTLVSAIDVHPNRRKKYYVSSYVVVKGRTYNYEAKRYVSEYAEYINENLDPYGAKLHLGERSEAKEPAYDDGVGVGGHFMQRAVAYCVEHYLEDLKRSINSR